jgi:catechol 2,3-dioxygenase-like lactoylglutathione lyase family enzyme
MHLADVTPNLVVTDIDRSRTFYCDVLGFSAIATVPDAAPFVFVWLQRDGINVFLNARHGVGDDVPGLSERPVGGTNTMFMTLEADSPDTGVDALYHEIGSRATVVMPLKTQFYGMREFAVEDPDGYVIFFAQRVG